MPRLNIRGTDILDNHVCGAASQGYPIAGNVGNDSLPNSQASCRLSYHTGRSTTSPVHPSGANITYANDNGPTFFVIEDIISGRRKGNVMA